MSNESREDRESFPPGLVHWESEPGEVREFYLSLLRRLLHPFRRQAK